MHGISQTNSFPLVCLLTVEICQFFDIVSQVSCHSQGLSHLQVGLAEEERREKVKKTHEEPQWEEGRESGGDVEEEEETHKGEEKYMSREY